MARLKPPHCARSGRLICVSAACLLSLFFATQEGEGASHPKGTFIEAEDFDGLVRYPFWSSDVGGWYALESITYLRGTRAGYVACVHKGSKELTMVKTLSKPLPPGSYHVFLKVFRCRWRPETNVVQLSVAEVAKLRTRKAAEVAHNFRWQENGGWLGPQKYDLKAPAEKIMLTAVHFGGASFGLLQESKERVILIDALYITSELDERPTADGKSFERPKAKSTRGQLILRKPLASAAAIKNASTPIFELHTRRDRAAPNEVKHRNGAKAIEKHEGKKTGLLSAFLSRFMHFFGFGFAVAYAEPPPANLLHNSSFELGINDGWACYCSAREGYILSEDDLDTSTAAHGRRSLRLPTKARPFSKLLQLKSADQLTFSAYLRAAPPTKVVLSVSAPTDRAPKAVMSKEFEVTEEWRRFSLSGGIEAGHYCVSITPRGGVAYWIDALQLQCGPLTDYAPRRLVEGALTSGRYANIVYDDETAPLLRIYNDGPAPRTVSLQYLVVDVWEREVAAGNAPAETVPPKDVVEKRLDIGLRRRGIFSLTYSMENIDSPDGETLLCVIPRPDGQRHRHELAANMDFAPHVFQAMRRAGYLWQLYCKIHFIYLGRCQPKPGQFNWDDHAMDLAAKYDYNIMPCFFPSTCPDWMDDPDYAMEKGRLFTRHSEAPFPKLDLYVAHVKKVVNHYKRWVKYWWMEDEAEGHIAPRDYGRLLNAAIPAVKEADPTAKVGISATPDYLEELLEYVDPKSIDIFGGSTYGGQGWMARKVRHLCGRYGKEWFIIGVGRNRQPSFYHTNPSYRSALGGAMGTAQHIIAMTLVQDARVIGHYTGRLTNFGGHRTFDYPLMDYDGTFLPHGLTYTCLTRLLADAAPLDGLELKQLDTTAYLFELHGRVGAAMWGKRHEVRLPFAKGEVELLDMYFNPLRDAMFDTEGLTFNLTLAPVFLWDRKLGRDEFINRLKRASAPVPPTLDLGISFMSDNSRRVSLGLSVRNGTEEQVEAVHLTLTQPSLYGVHPAWFLESREATIERIAPGQEAISQLPVTPTALSKPIENVRLTLKASAGRLGSRVNDELYMIPSAKLLRRPVLDGDLTEWKHRSAAWIFTCWGWSRIGRGIEQIESGGEYVSYAGSGDNGVAIWSGWDVISLYFAFEVFDDDLRFDGELRDALEVIIGPKPCTLTLRCDSDRTPRALLDGAQISSVACRVVSPRRIQGRSGRHGRYTFEVSIPWSRLDVAAPRAIALLGFDCRQKDVDEEGVGLRRAVLRWAGNRRGAGQLLLAGSD